MTQRIQTDIIDYAIAIFSAVTSKEDNAIIYSLNRLDADYTIQNKVKLDLLQRYEIKSRIENLSERLSIYYQKIIEDLHESVRLEEIAERVNKNHKGSSNGMD